jgi:hypothetical protein
MAVIDYKPNRDVRSVVDLYYSQFDQKEIMRGMMWNSADSVTYRNPQIQTIGGIRLLTGGTMVNLEPIVRNDYNHPQGQPGRGRLEHHVLANGAGRWTATCPTPPPSARR